MPSPKNFAYSTIATAPSPASSGTSLIVSSGEGALFPDVPFFATVWPGSSVPLSFNAEIVKVTAVNTDTFTIERAKDGTSSRSITTGDQIMASLVAGMFSSDAWADNSYDGFIPILGEGGLLKVGAVSARSSSGIAGSASLLSDRVVYQQSETISGAIRFNSLAENRTWYFPDENGTVLTTGGVGTITNDMLAGSITLSKIRDNPIILLASLWS